MSVRVFRNSGEGMSPAAFNVDRRVVIGKVMASGGVVRQVLHNQGIVPDTRAWQDMPGEEVVVGLFTQVEPFVGTLPDDQQGRIAKLQAKFAACIGAETSPEVEAWRDRVQAASVADMASAAV